MVHYRIITPEQVTFRYEVAGLVSRGLAWLTDMILMVGLFYLVGLASSLAGRLGLPDEALFFLGAFVVLYAYFVAFELLARGQSPGKKLWALRVISTSGAPLTFAESMLRNLLRPIDQLLLVIPVGAVAAFIDRYHRRLGDLAAGTLVIRDLRRQPPRALGRYRLRDNSFAEDPLLCRRVLARISRDERDLIYDLVQRRDQLDPQARQELFAQAADHFRQRFDLPADLDHLSDEQTVINLALLLQDNPTARRTFQV